MKVFLILTLAAAAHAAPAYFFSSYPSSGSFFPGGVVPVSHSSSSFISPNSFSSSFTNAPIAVYSEAVGAPLPYSSQIAYSSSPVVFSAPQISYGAPQISYPITYTAEASAVPVQKGYLAQTRGSTHVAPLPEGLAYASHHINLQPAPGTK